jgi:hypothetical protein
MAGLMAISLAGIVGGKFTAAWHHPGGCSFVSCGSLVLSETLAAVASSASADLHWS